MVYKTSPGGRGAKKIKKVSIFFSKNGYLRGVKKIFARLPAQIVPPLNKNPVGVWAEAKFWIGACADEKLNVLLIQIQNGWI